MSPPIDDPALPVTPVDVQQAIQAAAQSQLGGPFGALVTPEIASMAPYTPGKPWRDLAAEIGVHPSALKLLAANENVLGPSPRAVEAATAALADANWYPDGGYSRLRAALADRHGVTPHHVAIGNGSNEIIELLVRAFLGPNQTMVTAWPSFVVYRLVTQAAGRQALLAPLRDDRYDLSALAALVDARTKLVFIANPNNPTGTYVPKRELAAFLERIPRSVLVVIDEAYQEFSATQGFRELQTRYDHVVLLRTLSKFVSLAGVRCGALIGRPELIEFLGKVLPPYTFPTPSIELVMAALATDSLQVSVERTALLRAERTRLADALKASPRVTKVWPSDANFVLVETTDGQGFTECARGAGILVRSFPADAVLTNCIRITVGRPEDNDRLLQAVSSEEITDGD